MMALIEIYKIGDKKELATILEKVRLPDVSRYQLSPGFGLREL